MRTSVQALWLAALLPLGAASAPPAPGAVAARFEASAGIRPQARSDDGRYALSASLKVVPEATSTDGRFALKAVHLPGVGCEPFADAVFADGFEGP